MKKFKPHQTLAQRKAIIRNANTTTLDGAELKRYDARAQATAAAEAARNEKYLTAARKCTSRT